MLRSIFVTLFILSLTACTSKQQLRQDNVRLPKGWFLSNNNTGVKILKASEEKEIYRLNFDRSTENPDDIYYIQTAEALFPTQKKIRSSTNIKLTNWYFERLWWGDEYKGFRIPYSITGDAVIYYINQYKAFKQKFKQYPKDFIWNQGTGERVTFQYTATVNREFNIPIYLSDLKQSDDEPVKVTLHLLWYYYCGQPCGWGFEQKREVIFLSKNKIVEVRGDGTAQKWVSTKAKPFAPDQWITY